MRWSRPIGWLVAAVVLLAAVGSVVTLGIEPLGLAGAAFEHRMAATGTVLLVVVVLLVAVVLGTRSGRGMSTPYW
ncbi:hypothetical protein BRD00_03930 [Halobacteriales archaeon QS_8_69_26]|nr:MAG: hypothetical protein BRD00_03930 [Halobacteriales archaeon QS_8_69_26]